MTRKPTALGIVALVLLFATSAQGEERMHRVERMRVKPIVPGFSELIPNYNVYFCIEGCRRGYCQKQEVLEDCTQRLSSLLAVEFPESAPPDETKMEPIEFPGPIILDPSKPSRAHALGFFTCMNNC